MGCALFSTRTSPSALCASRATPRRASITPSVADMLKAIFGDGEDEETKANELFDRYAIDTQKKYGEGGYGAVYPGVDRKTNERLGVKVIDTRRMRVDQIEKECAFLNALDHPNVIKVKAHGKGKKSDRRVSGPLTRTAEAARSPRGRQTPLP